MDDIRIYGFDGAGGVQRLAAGQRVARGGEVPGKGFVWAHVDGASAAGRDWLAAAGLDRHEIEALLAEETRPRCTLHGDIALIRLADLGLWAERLQRRAPGPMPGAPAATAGSAPPPG